MIIIKIVEYLINKILVNRINTYLINNALVNRISTIGFRVVIPQKVNPRSTLEYYNYKKTTFYYLRCNNFINKLIIS